VHTSLAECYNDNKQAETVSNEKSMDTGFSRDVLRGLTAKEKSLSPKYFYDDEGSALFDRICRLDEYYPYQAELKLLPVVALELKKILTEDYTVVEFGAGSLLKIKPLLENVKGIRQFIPIDISGNHLREACAQLSTEFPAIDIQPVEADFCQFVDLGQTMGKPLGFFPGSTIGNFSPSEATQFLANAKKTVGSGGYMLVGVDTKKSPVTLHRAYNDNAGVTAQFNLNMLTRINRELGANFNLEAFEHYAYYDTDAGCIKMHLVSLADQRYQLLGEEIVFNKGESVHTESSYKYRPEDFSAMADRAGWQVEQLWLAENEMFSTFLLRA